MPITIRIKKKNIVVVILGVVFFAMGIGGYFAYVKYFQKPVEQKVGNTQTTVTQPENVDKNLYPPIADAQKENVMPDEYDSANPSDYSFFITSLGNPTYTFYLFYKKDWGFSSRDVGHILFEDENEKVKYGVNNYGKDTKEYSLKCEKILKQEFENGKFTNLKTSDVTLYTTKWNRVEFDLTNNGSSYHGIYQCFKNTDSLFEHFLLVTDDYWKNRDTKILTVMDKIKISQNGVEW